MTTLRIGQTVETTGEQQGIVRYVGPIHVSDGIFVGIELSTATGKNDGSVRGERYFSCPPGHGLFVKDASVQVIAQAPPPRPATAAATPQAAAARPRPPTSRPRPSSVIAPKPAPRASTFTRRQSVAPTASSPAPRAPVRRPSIASSTDAPARPTHSASRPSISSTTAQNAPKTSRDPNIETLQTKLRHLEKQHAEDQERLRELTQIRDERDRFSGLIQKLQTKCQTQYVEAQDLKEKARNLQLENETLSKAHQDHEVDLEDALLDKEMAEERAEQADAEIESLRKRIDEQSLELDILRDEAELFTAEMTEDEKQEAGYYRLQHENERLRHALVTLKEMTEEREQDLKARILGLETDVTQLDAYEQEVSTLHQRLAESDALIEHLKQQLDAENETEDMVSELTHQNQLLSDRIAEQDMVVQDLENLRELNDELEAQHLEQEEDMLAELEDKNSELAEQARRIAEQTAIIADHESLISKFRDLVVDLQSRMADAESSKTMTEAQVKDTTGRFNEVMDLNRQLHAATVQSTTREIETVLVSLKADQLAEKLEIWNETESKEFTRSESLQAYLTAERIAGKAGLLSQVLTSTCRQMSNSGRLDDAMSRLVCSESISHLDVLRDGSNRLWSAIRGLSLSQFASIGPIYQELLAIEQVLDQGLNALKADTVNFEELAGSIQRSIKIHEAVLMSHQETLAGRPEDELLSRATSIKARLGYISYVYDVAAFTLQKAPIGILEGCEDTLEHFKTPSETTKGVFAAAAKFQRTLQALQKDNMYPRLPEGLDDVAHYDDGLAQAAEGITVFARKLINEVTRCSSLSEDDSVSAREIESMKTCIDGLDADQRSTFLSSGVTGLAISLRNWTDHAAVLNNNTEIEIGPTPWAQKAKEVEAARKKDDEAVRQLQTLTAEHRATVLKIHEREQVIATKELEIEHLIAKNRDAATKTEGVEALQEELSRRHDKITELETLLRTQELELETQRDRVANARLSEKKEAELAASNSMAAIEPAHQGSDPRNAPAGLKTFLHALQNENHWLREREYKDAFDRNVRDIFGKMPFASHETSHREEMAKLASLELTWLTDDDDSDDLDTPPRVVSPTSDEAHMQYHISDSNRHKMSALALTGVKMGWQESARNHRLALQAAEEDFMDLSLLVEGGEDSVLTYP
ncbi:hypothetical protein EJ02DRAFT_454650 [Clathrospora elynae]|uniref:CAP-Gly domain-containing protein n=1 Tax=Clathrospora elynae TaxID=706981 RepID=A0A6A5SQL3_9PLEO|nr:hypothetical protein EJ02DRAFT_454650 [Clathrospora elynae]